MEAVPTDPASLRFRVKVGEVLTDYCVRRSAVIKALTDDAIEFLDNCDPDEDRPLCLFAEADGRWMVAPPPEDIPMPVLGINFGKDRVAKEKLLAFVADGSHFWLFSVAFYKAWKSEFSKEHRNALMEGMGELPKVATALHDWNECAAFERTFRDFLSCRNSLIKALTDDVDLFYEQCDPNGELLCLFGDPNGQWRLGPEEERRDSSPHPFPGININRGDPNREKWLSWVAEKSDYWLNSWISDKASKANLDQAAIRCLLNKWIGQLPTLDDIVRDRYRS